MAPLLNSFLTSKEHLYLIWCFYVICHDFRPNRQDYLVVLEGKVLFSYKASAGGRRHNTTAILVGNTLLKRIALKLPDCTRFYFQITKTLKVCVFKGQYASKLSRCSLRDFISLPDLSVRKNCVPKSQLDKFAVCNLYLFFCTCNFVLASSVSVLLDKP